MITIQIQNRRPGKRAYYNLRQTTEMSCQEYFERVKYIVEVIKVLEVP